MAINANEYGQRVNGMKHMPVTKAHRKKKKSNVRQMFISVSLLI
jgi:hypothetical protein